MSRAIPKKYNPAECERRWIEIWEESGIFRWDPSKSRDESFIVDTPPPTVSGSLHVGHVFSYTQTDIIVRYQRMRGKNIAYPMGWDDNGLPTERRVQNYFSIRCNPALPYNPDFKPRVSKNKDDPIIDVSRQNFIEACHIAIKQDEAAFEALWRHLGLSLDWSRQYETINSHCRKISQYSFLDLVKKGQVYSEYAPTMWDVDFGSAVAQAEVEDREIPGAYHDLRFGIDDGGEFVISTTRPELLPACIAVVAHPDDERYRRYFGKKAITPLFEAEVPILPAAHAEPEKGTGIMMVCTFGDSMDVEWWKQSDCALKQVISPEGTMLHVNHGMHPFESRNPEKANTAQAKLSGLPVKKAKSVIAELLAEDGSGVGGNGAAMTGDPKPIIHPVKFYEKGSHPLEFISTRQWFIKTMEHKEALIAQGRKINWYPDFMRARYESWVEGLNQDWCISRQRYFGVPFPVWYPIDDTGNVKYDSPIFADPETLPVDPLGFPPPGFAEEQRDRPGGFCGDPDVMDTWATSSLTPQIQSHWSEDQAMHEKLFPMDIRPQAHEIIRTWAFSTIVKAWMHEDKIPWKNIVISGWILDPDRKKMSKSKGNVITPAHLLDEYSADGVRYWAGKARLGTDTIFDENIMKVGRKLATKIFNASRFVLVQIDNAGESAEGLNPSQITHQLDLSFVKNLYDAVKTVTAAFDKFDYAQALQVTEDLFWSFCDNYLELVKKRSYQEKSSPEKLSALASLSHSLKVFLRLFAPFLPYAAEEVWSWRFGGISSSVHTAQWPARNEIQDLNLAGANALGFKAAAEVISEIRGAKTRAQKTLKWPVAKLEVKGESASIAALKTVLDDLLRTGGAAEKDTHLIEAAPPEGRLFGVDVILSSEA